MRISQTFEEDIWLFGNKNIFSYLKDSKILLTDKVRQDAWTTMGKDFIDQKIKKPLEIIFLYPLVKLKDDI